MFKRLFMAGAAAAVLGLASFSVGVAHAGGPIALPGGPIYIKFNNREQIAIVGDTGYANEINWGVLLVDSINQGNITGPNTIQSTGTSFFSNGITNNGQITGMFYGIEQATSGVSPFPAVNGRLDLYWRDLDIYAASDISTVLPGVRTSQSTATGYTDGIFLASIEFASGITTDSNEFISGTVVPGPNGFTGFATSYGNVDLAAGGLWADKLDGDWFNTLFGSRDFRFRNIYEADANWGNGPDIFGAFSTDPATTFVVPAPATLLLLGAGLVGVAPSRRKLSA